MHFWNRLCNMYLVMEDSYLKVVEDLSLVISTSHTLILDKCRVKVGEWKGIENKSANCRWEKIGAVTTCPSVILSRIRWQSNLMCFVRLWKTGFAVMWIAAKLSQYKVIGFEMSNFRSTRKYLIHVSSQTTDAMALYLNSADDLDTVVYFFDFQVRSELPIKTQKTVAEHLVSGQFAQLASEYATSSS